MKSGSLPPKWATRLLHAYVAPHLIEEIHGDLLEEFEYQVANHGIRRARLDYIRSVFGFIRPFAIRRKSSTNSTSVFSMNMISHFLKIAMRNLIRHRSFSFINVMGLALGMTCFIFIFLWTQDEKGIDNFHPDGDRLFTIYQTANYSGKAEGNYGTPVYYDGKRNYVPIADMKKEIPEITGMTFYASGYELPWGHAETFQVGDKLHKLEGSRASDDFFLIFGYRVLAGDAKTALKDLSSIAISRKMAALFFGTPEQALNKSLRFESSFDLTVSAVFEDVPLNSSLKFDYLINWESQLTRVNWASGDVMTALRIADNANVEDVQTKLNKMFDAVKDKKNTFVHTLGLTPYASRHLYSQFTNGKPESGRIYYVRIFNGVAVFILAIACINFMNLSTARSVKRAKEVGVRKVVGSSRKSLIGQFFGESIVLSAFALIVALLLVCIFLEPFNAFTGKKIPSPLLNPAVWPVMLMMMLTTGIVAGSYPALFLSSLKPVGVLKGVLRFTQSALWFRKGLAGFQFVISIVLLISTIVMSRQLDYIQHTTTGYDRENLIYSSLEGELAKPDKYKLFKHLLTGMPGIAMVDRSTEAPHAMNFVIDAFPEYESDKHDSKNDAIQWEGKEKGVAIGFKPSSVGFDFLKLMKLELVEGRDFSAGVATDSADAFLVNETAVKAMGMKDPLGKWVSAWKKKGHIIGVLKDYHTHSFHEPIKPLIIDVKEYEYFGVVMVRTEPGKTKEAIASMEKVYKEVNPNYAFAYKFMDQEYEKLYQSEQVITKLSNVFAVLAIIISCLGLLGLVMFSAEQRTKEFGIRKVLGATATNIISLLSQDFLKLVVVSFCIAAPLAGYVMHSWLQNFAFQISLSWWIFAAAGMAAVMVALLTICVQAFQSALANPIKSLRSE